jgi:tRNA-specific 2-thiouridylase
MKKDQSYVLWGLTQECLNRTRFPLGHMQKPDVRKYVYEAGYEEFSKKAESYEICFVPDNDYRGFLKRRVPELQKQVMGGSFINTKGEVIGKHEGYPFYTIGQRKGLGMAFGQPMFVTKIIPESNTVVLGEMDELLRNGMSVGKVNLQKYAHIPTEGIEAVTQIRYNDPGSLALVKNADYTASPGSTLHVEFYANVKGVAPGQSAVFYEGDDVVGGGIIMGSFLN